MNFRKFPRCILEPTNTDENLIFTNATSMIASALLHPAEKKLTYLLTQSILLTRLKNISGKLAKIESEALERHISFM